MSKFDWGPSPVDIDDIHDYYEGQQIQLFFSAIAAAEQNRGAVDSEARSDKIKHTIFRIINQIIIAVLVAIYIIYTN